MQQMLIYFQQLIALCAIDGKTENIPVTLEYLAKELHCSVRNIRIIIKKLEGAGWIRWTPGSGRGNRSQISFLVSGDELLLKELKSLIDKGNLKSVMELMRLPGISGEVKDYLLNWMTGYFGHKEIREQNEHRNILRFPVFRPITTLDPAEAMYAFDRHFHTQLFDPLVHFDPESRSVKPHIAYYWESYADHKVWTVYLRKGIRFHDGKELTAQDAAYTLTRLMERVNSSPAGWLATHIREVHAMDTYMLQIRLDESNVLFMRYLASPSASIVPEHFIGAALSSNRMPIGTGAFSVKRFDEFSCELEANTGYFWGRPHLDRIEIWFMPEEMSDYEGQGKIDLLINHLSEFDPPVPDWKMCPLPESCCQFLSFNLNKSGPQHFPEIRKAIRHIVDREQMLEKRERLSGYPAYGFMPSTAVKEDAEYNPELATEFVRKSGYSGEPLKMILTSWHEPFGRWIQEQCSTIGIQIEIDVLTVPEMLKIDKKLQADCLLSGIILDDDIDCTLIKTVLTPNGSIQMYLSEETKTRCDSLIDEMLREPLHEGHVRRIHEMEALLKEEDLVIFMFHCNQFVANNPAMRSVSISKTGWIDLKSVWFQPTPQERNKN